MWTFAQAIQEQVERFGAYVGIVAFFGLALLVILYFAQARELKRLRDWAGRAPERARELEERVMGQAVTKGAAPASAAPPAAAPQADAGAAVPAPGAPGGAAAEAPAEPPTEVAAAAGRNGAGAGGDDQATEQAATSGPRGADGDAPQPEGDGAVPPGAEEPVAASEAGPAEPAEPAEAESREPDGAPAEREPDEAQEPVTASAREPAAAPAASGVPPASAPGTAAGEAERGDSASDAAVPLASARAVGPRPSPRPATAAALRTNRPSASVAPRRPAPPPAASPAPSGRRRGGAGRIALIALATLLVIGGGAFAISSLGGGDEPAREPNRAEAPAPAATPDAESSPDPAQRREETTVAVLNGTTINGLAAQLAERLSAVGYQEGPRGNYTADQQRQESAVLYREGFEAQARDVGEVLEIADVQPIDAEARAQPIGDAEVVVVAGHDQAP